MEKNESEEELKPGRKKVNTVLFVIAATVLNLVIMSGMFLVLVVIYGRTIADSASPQINQVVVIVIFFVSIASAYALYHVFIKLLSKRVNMDKYFDPIIRFRGGRK